MTRRMDHRACLSDRMAQCGILRIHLLRHGMTGQDRPAGYTHLHIAGGPFGGSVDGVPGTAVTWMPPRQRIGGPGSQIQRPERQRTAVLLAYERAELLQACRLRGEQYGASSGAAGADVVRPVR